MSDHSVHFQKYAYLLGMVRMLRIFEILGVIKVHKIVVLSTTARMP